MSEAHPATTATVEHAPAAEHGAEASFFGLTPPWFIALAMVAVIAIMIWKRVPSAIGRSLDEKIALIRSQLDEAEALRKEAEALKTEYQAKSAQADQEAAALVERARHEAEAIVAKAEKDAEALIERRQRMAEDKIAAEELAAVNQLRATAADAASRAAAKLIAERHDAKADSALVDSAIKELGR